MSRCLLEGIKVIARDCPAAPLRASALPTHYHRLLHLELLSPLLLGHHPQSHYPSSEGNSAKMDIDMEIDYDASTNIDTSNHQPAQATAVENNETAVPAAYFESLDERPSDPWPENLNLQGVNEFDPNDPLYYAIEHCLEPRVKLTRWVNDNSVNLQYYSAEDAAIALSALTDPDAGDPASIAPQTGRKARPYSKRPGLLLSIRQANSSDSKPRGAANRSQYYKQNPDVRGEREERSDRSREPRRRQPPRRDFLDYDDMDTGEKARRSASGDNRLRDFDNRRNRRNDNWERDGNRERNGRMRNDVDTYRPGSKSPRESRFGRLRGRSASPGSADDGDGRYGFTEQGTSTRTRYRSRSRSRNNHNRRRREVSGDRWTHDRAGFDQGSPERWTKDSTSYFDASPSMSNHRRSDAFDETAKGSLLSRMTKDGRPLAPKSRSLASRITRDDDEGDSYGRLKDDYSDVRTTDFSEPSKQGLAGRITRDDEDGIQIRGRAGENEGINIRGASQGGFTIRGTAGGY
ncbi:unnamed protein product [Periconia digitata]|uniref:Uncharacterized protein n=1 Tax=Periconia digitata TaxID=1303443 RepID=A0A9W4XNR1_9PLEO|nr:unnamed protein product [Periconia digitata]